MKRLALLLGSLLVVTAAASAKEVVPAPVVVEEAPVQIVEKEVIVYRDKEEGFRPNGSIDLQYRYYGNAEGDTAREAKWAENNNSSRTQLKTKINMTEKQSLEVRVRDYNSLDEAGAKGTNSKTETRVRYWYNHGLMGDSKVNLNSRLHYRNKTAGTQDVEYSARFDFADYLFNNDFIKTNTFEISPKVGYVWGDGNDSDYESFVGVDLSSVYTLPAGFSAEFNVYLTQHFFGKLAELPQQNGTEDKNFDVAVEAYLYNTTNLYTNGNYAVDFVFEGGFDPYTWSQERTFNKLTNKYDDDMTYSLYAYPAVRLSYQATDFVNVYALAGAEYRNYMVTAQSSAQNWRWQPTATVGFTTTF
ncbi:hypothetical protein DW663_05345 [Fusobacterium mortiferum]|uniref:Porin n=1 Tax=Fusobacterium mortiferum TaxID=850 RepID=A0A414PWJ1_FUSMR|nr:MULTISPECIES: hypothetical protein [Fusobacterium]MDD7261352.1 hypothetical protein [Fusobacterium mortiferum]MSS60549.1 hypothetical protein [Fusobacterium sp. FSA-380-WT-2B]RHF72948.1 hypothetical protein DW663_05345 [Fusobacterium mortiferum]